MARKSVLIVDDDDDVREALVALLESEGYQVREARDGAEGIRELRGGGIGVVLLDLWMPRMTGEQFRAEQLKDGTLGSVPVVVITADDAVARKAAALGVQGWMRKPIEVRDLLDYVARYC